MFVAAIRAVGKARSGAHLRLTVANNFPAVAAQCSHLTPRRVVGHGCYPARRSWQHARGGVRTGVPSAIVLLSGGLDSTTTLAIARAQGFDVYGLTVWYGQRHACELDASRAVARRLGVVRHEVVELDLRALATSALTADIAVPKGRTAEAIAAEGVPSTYVPARNTILLSLALAWAETVGAHDIFLGVNVLDASGYPDCRPAFVSAFAALANVATANGGMTIHAPLLEMTKAEIILRGTALGVEYGITHSCYDPTDGLACGACDACILRHKGFVEAGVADPTRYVPGVRWA